MALLNNTIINGNIEITGQINTLTVIASTLTNSWVNYDSVWSSVGYYKDALNYVHLEGLTAGGSSTIFTLPIEYRPLQKIYFSVLSYRASPAGYSTAKIGIGTDGNVIPDAGCYNTWLSLDGIVFPAGS